MHPHWASAVWDLITRYCIQEKKAVEKKHYHNQSVFSYLESLENYKRRDCKIFVNLSRCFHLLKYLLLVLDVFLKNTLKQIFIHLIRMI